MLCPMKAECAAQISHWVYEEQYAVYSFEACQETIAELMDGSYYYVLRDDGALWGYFCFGSSAQIPSIEENVYTNAAVDFGLGMNPAFCGQGLGGDFFALGLSYAQNTLFAQTIRLTVASFNQRAIHLYEKFGFHTVQTVHHRKSDKAFYVMILEYNKRTD